MKKTVNYPELWQKMRSGLPVEGDPDADWLQMHSVLDNVMPVSTVVKTPYGTKALKLFYKLLIGVSTAVVVYQGVKLLLSKNQHQPVKNAPERSAPVLSQPIPVDSVQLNGLSNPDSSRLAPERAGASPLNQPSMNSGKNITPVLNIDTNRVQRGKNADTLNIPAAISTDKKDKFINVNPDSILSPASLNPINLVHDSVINNKNQPPGKPGNKANQKTISDSLKKVKKKKRFRIGVFF